jgi:hypothetical protein
MAVEFALPIRLPSVYTEREVGFPFRQLAADEGIVFPDHFRPARQAGSRARVEDAVAHLEPGVTELHVQPAIDSPEARAMCPDSWEAWVDDLALVTAPDGLAAMLDAAGVARIGFRDLRALQHAEPAG